MNPKPDPTATAPRHVTRDVVVAQFLLGLGLHLFLALPFLRRAHGLQRLRPGQRHLFVVNHISLLDTLLIATLCWRSRNYPILVLGDKKNLVRLVDQETLKPAHRFPAGTRQLNPNRISELEEFGCAGREFQLIVFPEGTRGDGVNVAECQPGIYFIAQEARVPIVPVFIENMQLLSTKTGGFHLLAGFRKVEVHFGEPIPPEKYLPLPREEFLKLIREKITAAKPLPSAARLSPVLHRV